MFESRLLEVVMYPDSSDCSNITALIEKYDYIKQYAYIYHDCEGKPHYHIMLQCFDAQTSERVARDFGVEENKIEKSRSKKKTHQYDDMLLYLTHYNTPEKHQYDAGSVVANFDYISFLEKKKNESSVSFRKSQIIDMIQDGTIKEYNLPQYITSAEYVKFERVIKSAFAYRQKMMLGQPRDMNVIYICGSSGCGKTSYAKKIASDKNLAYFISSSSNDIFCGYASQPCVILDDFRGFGYDYADLLKLFDNNTESSFKSRYSNKNLCEVQLLLITSSLSLDKFIQSIDFNNGEEIKQIKRRIGTLVRMTDEYIFVSSWDSQKDCFSDEICFENKILKEVIQQKVQKTSLELLGLSLSDSVDPNEFRPVPKAEQMTINKYFGGKI